VSDGRRRRPLRRPVIWLAPCLLACTWPLQAALQLQPVAGSLAPAQLDATRQLLDDATTRLPPAWADALGRISVQWRDDLPARVHGRAKGRRMLLDRALLDAWMARPTAAGVDDPATRAALAAVIHELAHFYDRTPQGRLSRDPRLLDLAGWQVSPARLGLRTPRNAFSDRSPDRYELDSPAEFVAVNLEYFLLDPSYACRRPALHRYFAAHFGSSPAHPACPPDFAYLQADADAGQSPLLQLDPERVYEVDYLLAEGNEEAMSRWGHSMLRLVVCAPGRPRGPDCRLDLQYHRVLSFRAFVDDVQVSSWRGLTGSYPSRLFVLPLQQVVEEYTKVELRGLRSIPLKLDAGETAALLERAARVHWSYDGRYYFVSNNCAVETYRLLHDGVPRLAGERLASITPTGLLRRLERAGVADAGVLDDPVEARRLGYYFEPASAHYQAMFDVAKQALHLPQPRVQDWFDLRPQARTPWLVRGDLRASAALLLLEEATLRRSELLARDQLKRRLLGHDADRRGDDARLALEDLLQLEGSLSRPAAILPQSGYGLPQAAERTAITEEGGRRATQWRQRGEHLRTTARQLLSPQLRADLAATEANIDAIGQRLRRLHREQGGLQLDRLQPATAPHRSEANPADGTTGP
jgi:hypothetical protein